jgi:hypothetical protein
MAALRYSFRSYCVHTKQKGLVDVAETLTFSFQVKATKQKEPFWIYDQDGRSCS